MKLLIISLIAILSLTGCAEENFTESEVVFTISQEDKLVYESAIENILNENYWYYDYGSLEYFLDKVPSENDMFYPADISETDKSKNVGKEAVVYTTDLIHFNGNSGGIAYFYFIDKEVVGFNYVPYSNQHLHVNFDTRNVFAENNNIMNFETENEAMNFSEKKLSILPNSFTSSYNSNNIDYFLELENDVLSVYRFSNNSFTLLNKISSFSDDLKPLSASYLPDGGIGVILGKNINAGVEGVDPIWASEKVVFYNNNLELTEDQIILNKGTYSHINVVENSIALINERDMELYEKNGLEYTISNVYNLGIQATALKEINIDNDENFEYIITNGLDLFVFDKTDVGYDIIWRTNISIDSFTGNIYTGDLNNDGVMEIYASDYTGTTIRYIVTPKGLESKNEDIFMGDSFVVFDFNNDGYSDYIKIQGVNEKSIFFGTP